MFDKKKGLKKNAVKIFVWSGFVSILFSYIIYSIVYYTNISDSFSIDVITDYGAIFQTSLQVGSVLTFAFTNEYFQALGFLIPVVLYGLLLYMRKGDIFYFKHDDASSQGLHGTANWQDPHELTDGKTLSKKNRFAKSFPLSLVPKLQNSAPLEMEEGIILGRIPKTNKLLIMPKDTTIDNKNVIVIGSSGSAKTQSYILPNIVNIRNESIICTDPKGEIYGLTSQLKVDQGYEVFQIDFVHFTQSRYNPLDFIETDLQAQVVANTIISNVEGEGGGDNVFFKTQATNMLSALVIYVKTEFPKEEANMKTVINIYTDHVQDEETFNEWVKEIDKDHPARSLLNNIIDLTGDTRGSVTSTLNNALSIFKSPLVQHMTSVSDFHIEEFVEKKSILYVKLSMEDDTFAPLTSVFFSQVIDTFYDIAKRRADAKLPKPVTFLLDEFANIGKINKYSRYLATCRGLGISLHTIIQNIAQLQDKKMYGHDVSKAILSNHDTMVMLRAAKSDKDTLEWISKTLGDTTKSQMKKSITDSKSGKSVSYNEELNKRPLMTPDEIGKLNKDEALVIINGHDPLFTHKAFQFKVFNNILSNEKREANYNNVRESLGFTSPLREEEVFAVESEVTFSEYYKKKQTEKEQEEIKNKETQQEQAKAEAAAALNREEVNEHANELSSAMDYLNTRATPEKSLSHTLSELVDEQQAEYEKKESKTIHFAKEEKAAAVEELQIQKPTIDLFSGSDEPGPEEVSEEKAETKTKKESLSR